MIEQFIKGSVWTTGTPMKVRGADIPVGTRFEVMYPRRRESNLVAIKFADEVVFPNRQNRHTSVLSRPKRGSKGRFHKADELVSLSRLEGAQLASLPTSPLEYFIRKVGSGQLWSGGRERIAGFYDCPFSEGNHYVSAENARVGVVTLLFKQWHRVKINENAATAPWEIVGYDPFAGEVLEVHEITPPWWDNIVRLAKHFKKMREEVSKPGKISTAARRIRALANTVPVDDRRWSYMAVLDDRLVPSSIGKVKEKRLAKMSDAGITEYLTADDITFVFVHDTDRVMMKLLFADEVAVSSL